MQTTYSNQNKYQQQYKQQNVMTASPGELTLMLYDGCIKFLKRSKLYMQERNVEKSSDSLIKAQAIISELASSLDMQYELSMNLLSLYEFMLVQMRDANVQKDPAKIDVVVDLITDLRNAWQEAVKLNRQATFTGEQAAL